MFTITKEVFFCYGHRLMLHPGKCRHLHGHSVKAAVTVEAEALDPQGMVCDFSEIKGVVQDFVDRELDHNLLLFRDDPIIPLLEHANERYRTMDQHPTAEYLAKLIYEHMKNRGFRVREVTLWETSSASATYRET